MYMEISHLKRTEMMQVHAVSLLPSTLSTVGWFRTDFQGVVAQRNGSFYPWPPVIKQR